MSIFSRLQLHTVTGGLIFVNTLLFLCLCLLSQSLVNIDPRALILLGAKEPFLIAEGEYWRLVTSMFLHAGWIHLLFNNIALRAVGQYMESFLGKKVFLAIYLLSGFGSCLCSNYFQLSLGVGASGAIFGLVGVGVVIENALFFQGNLPRPVRSLPHYFRLCPFSFLAVLNILIAITFNFFAVTFDFHTYMDNAAHLGGLGTGIFLTLMYLHLVENPLFYISWARAGFFFFLLIGMGGFFVKHLS